MISLLVRNDRTEYDDSISNSCRTHQSEMLTPNKKTEEDSTSSLFFAKGQVAKSVSMHSHWKQSSKK